MTTRAATTAIGLALVASACSGTGETEVSFTEEQLRQIEDLALRAADDRDAGDIELPPPPTGTFAPPDTRPLDDPPTAAELDIELDATGRPYDVEQGWYDGTTLVAEPVGTLHIADGELRVMDGSLLEVDPVGLLDGESVTVLFDVERLDLTMLFAAVEPPGDNGDEADETVPRAAVGVRLDVPGAAPVGAWQPYEFAYGTDGGVGGLTSGAIVAGAADQLPYSGGGDFFVEWDYTAEYYLGTHAGADGPDVFIWPNGFGDGGYPMSRGLDADGRLVALVLPTLTYPWRSMITDGIPPADVTEREEQYLECLRGERAVTVDGSCLGDLEF